MNFNYFVIIILSFFMFSACQEGAKEENETAENTTEQQEEQTQEAPAQPGMQQQTTEVSDQELEQFVDALGEIQAVNQLTQQKMISAVQDGGMEVERFSQIQEAQQSPEVESDATEKEMEQFEAAMVSLEKIQNEAEEEMQEKIEDAGLTENRYQEIGMALQGSPELQARFQELMGQQQPQQPGQPQ